MGWCSSGLTPAQLGLNGGPDGWVTQPVQHYCQTIIGEVPLRQFRQPGDPQNGLTGLPHPGLHRQFAMITLRQDMRQPDRRNPAPTQALLQAVTRQMAIQDRQQSRPLYCSQQQREIVNAFG